MPVFLTVIMIWQDLWAALALVLVIEGILPFLSPSGLRKAYGQMIQMGDRTLRLYGLISMIAGAVLLTLIR
jgi:hypothetical protein